MTESFADITHDVGVDIMPTQIAVWVTDARLYLSPQQFDALYQMAGKAHHSLNSTKEKTNA